MGRTSDALVPSSGGAMRAKSRCNVHLMLLPVRTSEWSENKNCNKQTDKTCPSRASQSRQQSCSCWQSRGKES